MGQPFPGPWRYDHHPWLRTIADCQAELMVGQKAAQMGFTEIALNKALKTIDIDASSVMYILPASKPDASDFSSSRFDPALEMSPHLQDMFNDVKNVYHKRAGNANLYLRGSRSRSQLKSVPVALLIADEVEEMDQENLPLAFERMSGQMMKQAFLLSTPRAEGIGINKYYKQTTEEQYTFKCPHCSKWIQFIYPDSLVITGENLLDQELENSYYICTECKQKLQHENKIFYLSGGTWVPKYTNRSARGFTINQMYSMALSGRACEMAKANFRADLTPEDEQELFNSKLGIPRTVSGARIEDKHIIDIIAKSNYTKKEQAPTNAYITMGIDIGKWIHFVIMQWLFDDRMLTEDINLMATARLLHENKVLSFEQLDGYMHRFSVMSAVIDAEPENRKSMEFCGRFSGHAKMCYYATKHVHKQISEHADSAAISVNRTAWLDLALGRVITGRIAYPRDLSQEFKDHMKALVRIYEKDRDGNPVGRYVKDENTPDHFAHACTYAEMALPLGLGLAVSQNIKEQV